jgi:hypothetical protein
MIVPRPLIIGSRLMAALPLESERMNEPNIGTAHIDPVRRDSEGRVVYYYVVEDADHNVITEGTDLRSGCGDDVDLLGMMGSLLSFLSYYGEMGDSTYEDISPEMVEWCAQHSESLDYNRWLVERDEDDNEEESER